MNTGNEETLAGLDQPVFITRLFEAQAVATPLQLVLKYKNQTLNYFQLNEYATALAKNLQQEQPLANIIGISTTRGIDMIIGVLAILKAGKAYLPLDPHLPAARLQQMVDDSGVTFCLASSNEHGLFEQLGLKCTFSVNDNNAKPIQQSLAYVLYTSGSTGKPKGVCMGHSALVNLLQWQQKNSVATVGTNTLQFAPLSFDVSFQEIFATITTGGTLVLMNEQLRYDHDALLQYIQQNQINRLFLPFVALQYLTASAVQVGMFPQSLQEVITAGEQLKVTPDVVRFFSEIAGSKLHNQYGPTECHVVTELILSGKPDQWPTLPNIGKPIDHTSIYILDPQLKLLPDGETGELCIGGISLAEGYLNRPDLTTEKFINWQYPETGTTRIYRTGDLARILPDGNIEFLGREDSQVKIRGYRIELGEIEVALNQFPGIKQAVVMARNDRPTKDKYLAAYLISADGTQDTTGIRTALLAQMPDYMVPAAFTWLSELPVTASGKVNTKALLKPEIKRPELAVRYKVPTTLIEKRLAEVWTSIIHIDDIGVDDNFFELGGNSLLAMQTVTAIKQQLGAQLPIIKLYQYPTISGIVGILNGEGKQELQLPKQNNQTGKDVAIIGMSGRFPGADTIDELWEVLKEGRETIKFFSKEELSVHIPSAIKNDPDYVRARGIINRADEFDAAFFNINPKVAELMDPQHRIFLEIAWEVLESTGYLPQHYSGLVAVFAGTGNNTYYPNNVWPNQHLIENVGGFQAMAVNEKDYIATRTAYALDLKGPAVSVHAACSTSLLAIAQAVESIRAGKCDVAVAGGISVTAPINSGYQYKEGAMLSPDGHCRPFDASSQGTVFSDGAGVVLLKSLEDAKRDGDYIYGVIKGIGVNNDGGAKGNFFAPSIIGQASAIATAIADAGLQSTDITYVEAHGTATPIGDPIEIEGLKAAFNLQTDRSVCAIGSIKSNMGHLTAAAGVAGLIKTLLAMRYKQLPASINFNSLNQNIDLSNSPFYVNDKLADWQPEGKRIAGVSSFGIGGTNVHVVVEEFENEIAESSPGRQVQLITWSAKTQKSLDGYAGKLAQLETKAIDLADAAYTLQTTRQDFNFRRFVVVGDQQQLADALSNPTPASTTKNLTESIKEIAFMFPGQDSRYVNMCRDLYEHEAVFKAAVNECAEILYNETGEHILPVIYPGISNSEAEAKLGNTLYTQPAIFATQYALAKLWMSWGITPTALIGHSIGELVAAHLAGIFSLNSALKFVAARSRLMAALPPGNMLAVRLKEADIQQWLIAGVDIAAINSRDTCVLSGPVEVIQKLADTFAENNIAAKLLNTSHAFHSAMLDPIIEPLREVLKTIKLKAPRMPMVSTVTGTWIKDAEATSAEYWVKQLRKTVRFADAVVTLQEDEPHLLLEVGVGGVTTAHARQSVKEKKITAIASLDHTAQNQGDYQSILKALGQLWLNGINLDWKAFYANQNHKRIELPAYAFDRRRFWVDPPVTPQNLVSIQYVQQDNPLVDTDFNYPATVPNLAMERSTLINRLKQILEDASGIDTGAIDPETSFIEMGMDSLLLTQLTLTLKKEFGLPLTFRQLNDGLHNLDLLSVYLSQNLPDIAPLAKPAPVYTSAQVQPMRVANPADNSALGLISQQLSLLSQQLALIQGQPQAVVQQPTTLQPSPVLEVGPDILPEEAIELKKPFGATARIEKKPTELNAKQAAFLASFIKDYNQKTAGSKSYTQQHRAYMADPRVVSGFKPQTKEITYSIVVDRSKGSRLWDIDGNEYVDALNGFGSNMFGYQPDVTKNAILEQIEKGYEIGPQHVLAGEVSKLICDFTGFDRSALCNTGSEAVLGAMRIARTVTGRALIVAFTGSYHGIVDEVIVRGTKKLKSFPAAPGIMPEAVQNMLILDYGTEESLKIIQQRSSEIAAVLVEPVQSRRPEFQPIEFLKSLRKITEDTGVVLVFDEVITGFRMHPGGTQAMFGIKADLGTYGKVIGGGLPIGAIAGKAFVMDALDGGFWQFGDDSVPEAGVTYFAGTFVRHPLALAAAKASLLYMKAQGPGLQRLLNDNTTYLAEQLNTLCEKYNLPLYAVHFGSLWKLKFKEEIPYGELLFTLMRYKGVHIADGFPCFLTEAHTRADIDFIVKCFKESATQLIESQIFENGLLLEDIVLTDDEAPVAGAKLGRDKDGNPGWFISDPENANAYLKIERK